MQRGRVDREALDAVRGEGRRLLGLFDPAIGPAPDLGLPALFPNAYAATAARPGRFLRLASEPDRLFVARLLADARIRRAGPDGTEPAATRLDSALARFWAAPAPADRPARLAVLTTDPAGPLATALAASGAQITAPTPLPALSPAWRSLAILRNTPADAAAVASLRRFGGDAVLADSCLLAAYTDADARRLAEQELGRAVSPEELTAWRAGLDRPPALLLGEVATASRHLFVFSPELARSLAERYGREAVVLPPPTPAPAVQAHAAGLWALACVHALEMLAAWGVACRLDVVGPAEERPGLRALAASLGVACRLGFTPGIPSLVLDLSMRGNGPSGGPALAARAAGLGCIVTASVAETVAVDARATLPDQPSPVLLAGAISEAVALTGDPAAAAAARLLVGAVLP